VLSAGGTLGHAFHAGVLAALAETTRWDPRTAEVIVGTSAGSLVASLLRAGLSAPDMAARTLGEPVSEEGRRLEARLGPQVTLPPRGNVRSGGMAAPDLLWHAIRRPGSVRLATALAGVLPAGQVSTEILAAVVRRLFGTGWPREPTWICAVRLDDGQRVVFGRAGSPPASLAEAVAASCAIPSFFEPAVIGGRRHVDGGVHSVTNLDLMAGLGLDLVVVSSAMSGTAATLGRIDLPIRAASGARLAWEAAAVRRTGTRVIVFQPDATVRKAMGLNLMDGRRRREVTRSAAESTRQRLERGGLQGGIASLLG